MSDERAAHGSLLMAEHKNGKHVSSDVHATPRKCTDNVCCGIFIALAVGMVYMQKFAQANGKWEKLTNGFDWKDSLCGVDADVAEQPFLFWCKPEGVSLTWQLEDGICVTECPTSTATASMCPGEEQVFYQNLTDAETGQWIITKGVRRNLTERQDYATTPMLKYCVPQAGTELSTSYLEQSSSGDVVKQVMMGFDYLIGNSYLIYAISVVSLIMGYAFMFFIRSFAKPLLLAMLLIAELGVLAVGAVMVYVPMCVGPDAPGVDEGSCPFTLYPSAAFYRENSASCTGIGAIVLLVWLLASMLLCCRFSSLTAVLNAIDDGATLVFKMPTLLLQPLLQVIVKLPVLVSLIWGLAWIVSLGDPTPLQLTESATGTQVNGLRRTFKFTSNEKYMLFFWVYMTVWIMESLTALGQFVISHAVVVFEVNESHAWFPLGHGYWNALVYHLGTVVFGGFVLGTLRIINAIVELLARQLKKGTGKDGKPEYSCVVEVLCCCCLCCMQCLMQMAELLNDLVYTHCALTGTGYLGSAGAVLKILGANADKYAIEMYAMAFLRTLGLLAIPLTVTYGVYEYMILLADPTPPDSGILAVTITAGVISLFVALAFMHTFVQSSITAMYVKMWEEGQSESVAKEEGYENVEDTEASA